jgi:hypothetical protein
VVIHEAATRSSILEALITTDRYRAMTRNGNRLEEAGRRVTAVYGNSFPSVSSPVLCGDRLNTRKMSCLVRRRTTHLVTWRRAAVLHCHMHTSHNHEGHPPACLPTYLPVSHTETSMSRSLQQTGDGHTRES